MPDVIQEGQVRYSNESIMGVAREKVPRKYKVVIIRAGEDHNQTEDDFTITGTALIDGGHVILKGFAGKLPKYFRRGVKKFLLEMGVETGECQIDLEPEGKYRGHNKI